MDEMINLFVDKIYQLDGNLKYEKEIYVYGISQGIMILFNVLFALVAGIVMGCTIESIVFSFCYFSLRRYSGGYHASKPKNCLVLSFLLLVVNLIFIKNMEINSWIVIAFVISGVVIFRLSPMEAINKPLDAVERAVFTKRIRRLICVQVFMALIFLVSYESWARCVVAVFISDAFLLGVGQLSKRKG